MKHLRILLFIFCVHFASQESDAQERAEDSSRQASVNQFIFLNNQLNDLDTDEFAEMIGLAEFQQAEIKSIRLWLDEHMSRIMIPKNQIVDQAQYENDWNIAISELNQRKEQLGSLLLPHQKQMYHQVELLHRLGFKKSFSAFTHPSLIDELGLTDEQQENIRALDDKLEAAVADRKKELERFLKETNFQFKEKSLGSLTTNQEDKYAELIGPSLNDGEKN